MEFLYPPRQQICRRLLVTWDEPAAHRSALFGDHFESRNGAILIEKPPIDPREFNRTDHIWGHLKHYEVANRCVAISPILIPGLAVACVLYHGTAP